MVAQAENPLAKDPPASVGGFLFVSGGGRVCGRFSRMGHWLGDLHGLGRVTRFGRGARRRSSTETGNSYARDPRSPLTTPTPSRNVARPEANRLEEREMEKWTLEIGDRDYLDGIQSGHLVRAENGAPVAYMFNDAQARLAAAAPELLEALGVIAKASERSEMIFGGKMSEVTRVFQGISRVSRQAIARATGADQ